jgi:hypothetical protein
MADDKYHGYYIAVPLSSVEGWEHMLPEHEWYNQRDFNSQFVFYGLKYKRYSYATASTVVHTHLKVHVVDNLEDFISFVLARDLNVDLRELFNGKNS